MEAGYFWLGVRARTRPVLSNSACTRAVLTCVLSNLRWWPHFFAPSPRGTDGLEPYGRSGGRAVAAVAAWTSVPLAALCSAQLCSALLCSALLSCARLYSVRSFLLSARWSMHGFHIFCQCNSFVLAPRSGIIFAKKTKD